MNEFIKNVGIFLVMIVVGGMMIVLFYDGLHYIGIGVRQITVPGADPFEAIIKGLTSLTVLTVPWLIFKVYELKGQIEKQKTDSFENEAKQETKEMLRALNSLDEND